KLEALGLVPGSEFLVVSNSLAGLILKVKESRLAIGYSLAKEVAVVPIDNYLADNALPPEAVDTPVESQPQSTSADEGGL
ncbi:MAG: ferrous iron transport protein A, partial [Coriobacteriia bacterium]|nr:ferrous iron transport protein A [Coriobacteriia bacterium]